jgi:hypothetical protein
MKHLNVAPCVYLPLCNSTDIWRRVHGTLYKERAFNTNEQCLLIINLLGARGEIENTRKGGIKDAKLDVVEYMHKKYNVVDEVPLENGEEGS